MPFDDDYDHTEMDRFSDEELTAIFNDPDAGGVLQQALSPILDSASNNAIKDADDGLRILRRDLQPDSDPLFFDRHFVYAFICNCRSRFDVWGKLDNCPGDRMSYMMTPALGVMRFDHSSGNWRSGPTDAWLRCADAVSWDGVLPADREYPTEGESGKPTSMVALKTSPIWKRLGYVRDFAGPHEQFPFDRKGRRTLVVVGIGRSQLFRACAATGVQSPKDRITKEARMLTS